MVEQKTNIDREFATWNDYLEWMVEVLNNGGRPNRSRYTVRINDPRVEGGHIVCSSTMEALRTYQRLRSWHSHHTRTGETLHGAHHTGTTGR